MRALSHCWIRLKAHEGPSHHQDGGNYCVARMPAARPRALASQSLSLNMVRLIGVPLSPVRITVVARLLRVELREGYTSRISNHC